MPLRILVLLVVLCAASARAQDTSALPDFPDLDAALRAAVVESVTAAIDSIYVLEQPAKEIVATLRENLERGAYDDVTDVEIFAQRLFEDAQAVNHDGHFGIRALPPLDPALVEARQPASPEEIERREAARRARNYGFREVRILPGGVAYVRFDEFAWGEEAFQTATAIMNSVANASAVIFDVRQNGGGSAAMIRHLCGYLFAESVHLVNWEIRAEGWTEQSHSPDFVPGRRIPDTPVYVLTSPRTFSAAEEFSFDLKNLERATLVGETTGGGGHTVAGYQFDFGTFRIEMRLPYGRAYFPPTGEGWEGKGVSPHVEVPAAQALDAAYTHALQALIAEAETPADRFPLEWALQDVESRTNMITLTHDAMRRFAGTYGPRVVSYEDGTLWYQRDGGVRHRLEPMTEDLFRVGDLDYFRLGFETDDDGAVTGLVGHYEDGRVDSNARSRP